MDLFSPSTALSESIMTLLRESSVPQGPASLPQGIPWGHLLQELYASARNEEQASSPHAGYGACGAQGLPRNMEDTHTVLERLGSPGHAQSCSVDCAEDEASGELCIPGFPEDLAFFSVFDGHGGSEVAQHCSDRLHQHFTRDLCDRVQQRHLHSQEQEVANIVGAASDEECMDIAAIVSDSLRAAFAATDEELSGTDEGEYVGATAVVAVISNQHIWLAHCGDSRAVIQRDGNGITLTHDHKPDREDEAARIRSAGGRIVRSQGALRVMGMLAMSRAVGDHYLRPYVIAEPEVSCIDRTCDDEVLILATDGLWDVFSVTEASTLAARCILRSCEKGLSRNSACQVASSVLANAAIARGSRDNVTIIVVDVASPRQEGAATAASDASGPGTSAVLLPSSTEEAEAPRGKALAASVGARLLLRANHSHGDLASLGGRPSDGSVGGGGTSTAGGGSSAGSPRVATIARSKSSSAHRQLVELQMRRGSVGGMGSAPASSGQRTPPGVPVGRRSSGSSGGGGGGGGSSRPPCTPPKPGGGSAVGAPPDGVDANTLSRLGSTPAAAEKASPLASPAVTCVSAEELSLAASTTDGRAAQAATAAGAASTRAD